MQWEKEVEKTKWFISAYVIVLQIQDVYLLVDLTCLYSDLGCLPFEGFVRHQIVFIQILEQQIKENTIE